jgi:2'-5' RNA ligase
MRVFVAIDLDREVRDRLEKLESELRPLLRRARWVPAENLHLTLRFLGEATKDAADAVTAGLREALAGTPGFVVSVCRAGVFPDRRRPRILWVGLSGPGTELEDLQSRVERVVRGAGFPPEKRRFEPHLTLARFREPERQVDSVLRDVSERDFGGTSVREVVVYESVLSRGPACYRPLGRIRLGAVDGGTSSKGLV